MKTRLEGLIAASFTPMNADGSVNLDLIGEQAMFLHRNGVQGAFVCGTTGESMSLTMQERMDIAERWTEVAPEGFKVIVHVGHTSLEVSKRLAANAQEIGAWSISAMGPCFFKPASIRELVTFCSEIAGSAPKLPFYYYHIPSVTGVSFPMVDFLEAAKERIPNLAGVKYTHHDLMDYELCRRAESGRFDILFGIDEMLLGGLAFGAGGAIGSTYNIAAPLYNRLIKAFKEGDLDCARNLQDRSIELVRVLNKIAQPNFVATKSVMKMLDVDCGPVRAPLSNITPEQYKTLEVELQKIGFFEYSSK